MTTNKFIVTVPVTFTKDVKEKTSFRRVGAAFLNDRRDGDGQFLSIKLDFPVAVSDLVAFPMENNGDNDITE